MSIFEASTPVDISPELDTEMEAAEEEIHEEEVTEEAAYEEEEQTEEDTDSHEEQSEQLLAGKFKTQDDLVKAYKNLERSFHESRQKPQQQQYREEYQEPQYQEDPNEIILRALQEDPAGTLRYFAEQSRAEERKAEQYGNTLSEIATTYKSNIRSESDLQTLTEKYWEIASDLGVRDDKSPRIMKLAAEELWGKQSLAQVYKQAELAGMQKADQSRKAKMGLSAPSNSKPKETPKSPEDLIAESIVSAGSKRGMFG